MPKLGEGLPGVDLAGAMPSGPATFAASQAAIASAEDGPGRAARRRVHRRPGLGPDPVVLRLVGSSRATTSSDPVRNRSRQAWRWTFPLDVLGRLSGLDQPDRMDLDLVLLGDRPADRRDDLVGVLPLGMPLDLVDDDEPFLAIRLDREGRAAARPERGVASLDGPLDILRDRCSARG